MKRIMLGILAVLFCLFIVGTPSAEAASRLFGTIGYGGGGVGEGKPWYGYCPDALPCYSTSYLVELDPASGAIIEEIGEVGYYVNGLTYDATTGKLYAGTSFNDPNFKGLIEINMTTGAGTKVGAVNWGFTDGPVTITPITVNSVGEMYGYNTTGYIPGFAYLSRINTTTGTIKTVGSMDPFSSSQGLSFNSADELYAVYSNGNFYQLDTVTGATTLKGTLGVTAHHGDFAPITDLYYGLTFSNDGTPRALLRCNLTTPSCTEVAAVGNLHTLTFVPTNNNQATVTFPFSGFRVIEAYEGSEGEETATLAGTVGLGDPVTGSLVFDSSTDQLLNLTININDVIRYTWPTSAVSTHVYVENDTPQDSFNVVTVHLDPLDTLTLPSEVTNNLMTLQAGVSLFDNEGEIYSTTDLPAALSLSDFDWGRVFVWTWFPDLNGDGVSQTAWRIMADFRPAISTNTPPVLDAIGNSWVHEGSPLGITLAASDADGDPISYSAVDLPPGASLDGLTGEFSWTPSHSQVGQYQVTFVVADGEAEDTETVTLSVFDGEGPQISRKAVLAKAVKEVRIDDSGKKISEFEATAEELKSSFKLMISVKELSGPEEMRRLEIVTFDKCPKNTVGFQVGDLCFDLAAKDVAYESIKVCVGYEESPEALTKALKLEHFKDSLWKDVTQSIDTEKKEICGEVSSLSPFAVIKSVGEIAAPTAPKPVQTLVNVQADFIDQDPLNTHRYEVDWGDGGRSAGGISEADGIGTAVGSHSYTAAGVYTVVLRVLDVSTDALLGEAEYRYLVVYDPAAGFVTGGGWINSPAGAYAAEPDLTGKASFGFVSRYQKGTNIPTGNTGFQFHAANFDFKSTSYDWLVISGYKATYKGLGTIHGLEGSFKFLLVAFDTGQNSDKADRFRLKVWSEDEAGNESVVYDNGFGAADDAEGAPQPIAGGSVVIHK